MPAILSGRAPRAGPRLHRRMRRRKVYQCSSARRPAAPTMIRTSPSANGQVGLVGPGTVGECSRRDARVNKSSCTRSARRGTQPRAHDLIFAAGRHAFPGTSPPSTGPRDGTVDNQRPRPGRVRTTCTRPSCRVAGRRPSVRGNQHIPKKLDDPAGPCPATKADASRTRRKRGAKHCESTTIRGAKSPGPRTSEPSEPSLPEARRRFPASTLRLEPRLELFFLPLFLLLPARSADRLHCAKRTAVK